MKLFVTVKPNSRRAEIVREDVLINTPGEMHLKVAVIEPPIEGRANMAVIAAVADYLKVPKTKVRIIKGATSKRKTLEII